MVTTRRQTAGTSTVSKASTSETPTKGASILEEDLSELSEEEEEQEPRARRTRRKAPNPPKAKRRKVATATDLGEEPAGPKAPKRRRGKDLSLLVTMPLDVLFAILGLLLPKDLLNVSQTSQLFQQTLAAQNAKTVWIAARSHLGAPEPPRDITEARWAALLFRSTCQVCGAKGVLTVDFMLRRRVCTSCKKAHLVVAGKFQKTFPLYDKGILQYVLHTNVGGWANGHTSGSRFHWDEDVDVAWKTWSTLQSAVRSGQRGARDAVTRWKEDKLRWVEDNLKLAGEFTKWHYKESRRVAEETQIQAAEHRVLRLAAVKQRFVDAGFIASDINAALDVDTDGINSGVPNVTNGVWSRLGPKLEPLVVAVKEERLDKELQDVVRPRMEAFKGIYEDYLSGLRPSEKRASPAYQFLRTIPDIGAIIDADKNTNVTVNDFHALVPKLPEYTSQYLQQYKKALAATVPVTDYKKRTDPLTLARFVFDCNVTVSREAEIPWGGGTYMTEDKCSSGWMVGWPLINDHLHEGCTGTLGYGKGVVFSTFPRHTVKFNERASVTAAWLVTLAGLDPKTTTIDAMDRNKSLFVCTICRDESCFILDWRQVLRHTSAKHPYYSWLYPDWKTREPTFRLATEVEKGKAREADCALEGRLVWRCDHCPGRESTPSQRSEVIDHLRIAHDIAKPRLSKDYVLDEPARWAIPPYEYGASSTSGPPAPGAGRS